MSWPVNNEIRPSVGLFLQMDGIGEVATTYQEAIESLWVAFPAACGATLLGKSPVWSTIGLIPRRLRRGGFIGYL